MKNKKTYHLSAVPRNTWEDWSMIPFYWFGREHKIDGKLYTLRYSSWLDNFPSLRDAKIRELEKTVVTSPSRGHRVDEAYLSESDLKQ